jgi:hypothetical protein
LFLKLITILFTSRSGAATQRFFIFSHAAAQRRNVFLFFLTQRRSGATLFIFYAAM